MVKTRFSKININILSVLLLSLIFIGATAQNLMLRPRSANAIGGTAFGELISDSALTLEKREKLIYKQIKKGNIPNFLRKLSPVNDTVILADKITAIRFYALPDYLAVGTDSDYIYMPMTPILAQKLARFAKCTLPTRKMVDMIYKRADVKLDPQPIPPSKAMTTVPAFIAHNDSVQLQLRKYFSTRQNGALTAGNKKDVIISNKIYSEKTHKVVIYGWHRLDGKPIQPMYNKHTNLWADYSHGIRLVHSEVLINGKKHQLKKVLKNIDFASYFSDEGPIAKPFYPITAY